MIRVSSKLKRLQALREEISIASNFAKVVVMHACGIDKKALSQGAKAYAETLEDDIMTATSKDTLDGEELLKILKRPEAKAIRGQWINWKTATII